MSRLTFTVVALLAPVVLTGPGHALPRMTLTTGAPCANCHVDPQGSGLRTDLGWYAMNQTGAWTWKQIGWNSLHNLEDNTLLDGKVSLGLDYRGQMARLGRPTRGADGKVQLPDRKVIPMQLTPEIAVMPTDTVTVTGSMNAAAFVKNYPGQSPWQAWARWQPSPNAPYVRAGMMQPSVGIRHDDHTMLLRSDAASPRQPMIPPDYADPGVEVGWSPVHWLLVQAGALWSRNLSDAVPTVAIDEPGASGRIALFPQLLDLGLNGLAGASYLRAGDLQLTSGYAGVGKNYWGTLLFEASHATRSAHHSTLNLMLHATVPVKDWLTVEGRAERATSELGNQKAETRALVAGLQFEPVPFVELRPEYRYLVTDDYTLGQYTLQLHLFF